MTQSDDTAKKAAIGTVTVLGVLTAIFCGLPLLGCVAMTLISAVTGNHR